MTKQGRGGVALGITMLAAVIGAAFGILQMVFMAPFIARIAFSFGPQEICTLMLLGLLAGATLAKGSAVKGVSMTLLGILLSLVGTDVNTGNERFTFGQLELSDGLELVTVSLGLFGIAEFLKSVNAINPAGVKAVKLGFRDLRPSRAELRQALPPVFRGTIIGSLCSLIPGTGPTIASFIAYAAEKKLSKTPERFGHGAIEGVAAPEASTHSAVQGDFIPTMSLGIPGDAVMALLLGALMIQGIQPGPRLIIEQPDIFWGLIAIVLDRQPDPGVPERAHDRRVGEAAERALPLSCTRPRCSSCASACSPPATRCSTSAPRCCSARSATCCCIWASSRRPSCWASCWGRRLEENFRRSVLLSRGSLTTFVDRPISAVFLGLCLLLVLVQIYAAFRRTKPPIRVPEAAFD